MTHPEWQKVDWGAGCATGWGVGWGAGCATGRGAAWAVALCCSWQIIQIPIRKNNPPKTAKGQNQSIPTTENTIPITTKHGPCSCFCGI